MIHLIYIGVKQRKRTPKPQNSLSYSESEEVEEAITNNYDHTERRVSPKQHTKREFMGENSHNIGYRLSGRRMNREATHGLPTGRFSSYREYKHEQYAGYSYGEYNTLV